jgi:hypothetical protein
VVGNRFQGSGRRGESPVRALHGSIARAEESRRWQAGPLDEEAGGGDGEHRGMTMKLVAATSSPEVTGGGWRRWGVTAEGKLGIGRLRGSGWLLSVAPLDPKTESCSGDDGNAWVLDTTEAPTGDHTSRAGKLGAKQSIGARDGSSSMVTWARGSAS